METLLTIQELKNLATEIRKDTLRSITAAGSGHPGGSLSAADIMTALYFRPANLATPADTNRDRIFWSKGAYRATAVHLAGLQGLLPQGRAHDAAQVRLTPAGTPQELSLIHISEPTRLGMISYAVFCLKKKKKKKKYETYHTIQHNKETHNKNTK